MNLVPFSAVEPWWWASHSLESLIRVVLKYSSKPKMVWVYTLSAIRKWPAIVKHAHSFWNVSEMDYPASTMRLQRNNVSSSSGYDSISLRIFCSKPQPTMIGFLNELPESFNKVCGTPMLGEYWIRMQESLPSKAIAFEGNSDKMSLHNVALINVVFSGGRPATTGARYDSFNRSRMFWQTKSCRFYLV